MHLPDSAPWYVHGMYPQTIFLKALLLEIVDFKFLGAGKFRSVASV